jgi:hypothetical protein
MRALGVVIHRVRLHRAAQPLFMKGEHMIKTLTFETLD